MVYRFDTKNAENSDASTEKVRICWRCGDYFNGTNVEGRDYCSECKGDQEKEEEELLENYLKQKMLIMWRRAVNKLGRQDVDIDNYYDEAQYVKELSLKDFNKFQSSPEMIAAMELLRCRVKTKVQHKISKYRVDFFLPELSVVLEIDGNLHDYRIKKDSNRDVAIMNELNKDGRNYEILRIPAKYIEENVKQLVPAIKGLYKERQRLRKKNGGFLPTYYSKHDTMQQLKVINALGEDSEKPTIQELETRFKKEWKPDEF